MHLCCALLLAEAEQARCFTSGCIQPPCTALVLLPGKLQPAAVTPSNRPVALTQVCCLCRAADTSGNGMLSGDEVLTLLNKLGHKLNSSKLAKIMEEYDKDQWAPTTTTTAAAAAATVWQA